MTFKKALIILLCCTALLTACNKHTHEHSSTVWNRDIAEHWQDCDCGETFGRGEHNIEDSVCAVCGSEIWSYDGGTDIYNYDENGDLVRITCYDSDGNVYSESVTETEYDENGNKLKAITYEDGKLIYVEEYAVSADGKNYAKTFTSYLQSGSIDILEYDENGNIAKNGTYSDDGTVLFEETYEYKTDSQGIPYPAKQTTTNNEYGTISVYETTEYGDIIFSSESTLDGTVIYEESYEIEYDENGNKLWEKHYVNGVLADEVTEYIKISEEGGTWSFPKKNIEYFEDGSTRISEYNEYGELISEKNYDANGFLGDYYICECEYDENGNIVSRKTYNNGSLSTEEEYALDKDGWPYVVSDFYHYPEMNVSYYSTYNEYGEQTSRTVYDGDGNVTQEDIFEYEYDENGDKTAERHYTDGVLMFEAKDYVTEINGSETIRYPTSIIYNETGIFYHTTYNEYGEQTGRIIYDGNGNVTQEDIFEYEYDENGNKTSEKHYTNGVLTYEATDFVTETDEFDRLSSPSTIIFYYDDGTKQVIKKDAFGNDASDILYDADGSVLIETIYEYEYEENGEVKSLIVSENGRPVREDHYAYDSNGLSFFEKGVYYMDDGSKIENVYNEFNEILSETTYSSDGSVLNETKYEYQYDINHNVTNTKVYENGRLAKETVNKNDNTGWWTYVEKEIIYYEDGSKFVTEYDQYWNVISETIYDINGNEIVE